MSKLTITARNKVLDVLDSGTSSLELDLFNGINEHIEGFAAKAKELIAKNIFEEEKDSYEAAISKFTLNFKNAIVDMYDDMLFIPYDLNDKENQEFFESLNHQWVIINWRKDIKNIPEYFPTKYKVKKINVERNSILLHKFVPQYNPLENDYCWYRISDIKSITLCEEVI